jgi:phage terminase small subunit
MHGKGPATLTNAKHEAVALAYLADPERVGWRAYRKVYPKSTRHAAECGFTRLQKNVEFSARIAELAERAADGAVMAAREVLEELTRLARANMQDYVGPDDIVVPMQSLTRDQAAAVQERTVEHYTEGGGDEAREVKKIKFRLADKLRALELLGKHHALFTDRHVHEVGGIAERLAAALARMDEEEANDRPRRGKDRSRHAATEHLEEPSMPARARRHRARRRGAA